ncbi:MAG: carbohydrate-binding protein [Planctomycetota bacterium]
MTPTPSTRRSFAKAIEPLEGRRLLSNTTFAPDGQPWPVDPFPTRIEAEDYDLGGNGGSWFDDTLDNLGGEYRVAGPDIQNTLDTGGAFNIGWTDQGEYLTYTIDVEQAGTYDLSYRVASLNGGRFFVEADGTTIANFTVPATGAWQTWTTITETVTLDAGVQELRFNVSSTTGININWFELEKQVSASTFNNDGRAWNVFGGDTVRIQAEDYDTGGNGGAWFDDTLDNLGGEYRVAGPDIETTIDFGGGFNIGYIDFGEYLQYTLNVENAGTYDISFRVAGNDGRIGLTVDGVEVGTDVDVPSTGGWQIWQTITSTVELDEGVNTLQLEFERIGFNLNWFELTNASAANTFNNDGLAWAVPETGTTTIEAEDYNEGGNGGAWFDTTLDNTGGKYRLGGPEITEINSDPGDFQVSWIGNSEYFEYTIDVETAGTSELDLTVASPFQWGKVDLFNDGDPLGSRVFLPDTGSWDTYADVTTTVQLDAGVQTIRFQSVGSGWHFDQFSLTRI